MVYVQVCCYTETRRGRREKEGGWGGIWPEDPSKGSSLYYHTRTYIHTYIHCLSQSRHKSREPHRLSIHPFIQFMIIHSFSSVSPRVRHPIAYS